MTKKDYSVKSIRFLLENYDSLVQGEIRDQSGETSYKIGGQIVKGRASARYENGLIAKADIDRAIAECLWPTERTVVIGFNIGGYEIGTVAGWLKTSTAKVGELEQRAVHKMAIFLNKWQ